MVRSAVIVRLGSADLASRWRDEITDLYVEVFSAPPFVWCDDEGCHQRNRLSRLMLTEGFTLALAVTGSTLIGFVYGAPVPSQQQRGFLPDRVVRRFAGPAFHVTDFAVRQDFRFLGVGRSLHDSILSDRSEKWATLAVQPQAGVSISIYERWGWRKIAQHHPDAEGPAPSLDIYAHRLGLSDPSVGW
ncbi:GNAT family N-acetyltransferase [Streptomyces capillispiralis]|uniref:GNAT family N-acetyltransferase n=1 Tax=Streptomyces capillispiralis TaxID=68182 RepID=UPI00357123C7